MNSAGLPEVRKIFPSDAALSMTTPIPSETSEEQAVAHQTSRCRGFTIFEFVVVLVVLVLLAALLFPFIQQAREASRRNQCQSHLRQIGLAFQQYDQAFRTFPASYYFVHKPDVLPGLCCYGEENDGNIHLYTEMLLPYLDQTTIYNRINFSAPYFSPHDWPGFGTYTEPNQAVTGTVIPVFLCPTAPHSSRSYTTSDSTLGTTISWTSGVMDYSPSCGVWGNTTDDALDEPHRSGWLDGVLSRNHRTMTPDRISDGASNVILMFELAGRNEVYRVGRRIPGNSTVGGGWADFHNAENWLSGSRNDGTGGSDSGTCLLNCTNESGVGMYGFHEGLVNVLMADGVVRSLNQNTENGVIIKLISIDGGASLSEF